MDGLEKYNPENPGNVLESTLSSRDCLKTILAKTQQRLARMNEYDPLNEESSASGSCSGAAAQTDVFAYEREIREEQRNISDVGLYTSVFDNAIACIRSQDPEMAGILAVLRQYFVSKVIHKSQIQNASSAASMRLDTKCR